MDISIILVFLGVFLLSYFLTKKKQNLPPGYFGIPFIGSLSLLRKFPGRRPHVVLYEESKRFGPIFRWYIGRQMFVGLNGYDVINEALVKKADAFSDRPTFINVLNAALPSSPDEKGVLFCQYNAAWREMRRFSLHALRDFGVGKTSIEEQIMVETEAVTSILQSLKGEPTAMDAIMQKLVGNVIYSIIFGKRYEYDDPNFDMVRSLTNVAVSGSGAVGIANFLPGFITRILNKEEAEIERKRKETFISIRKYIYEQIDEHEATFDEDNIRDFVDIYLKTSSQADGSVKKFITKGNMFRVIIDLFLAGSETTSNTLDWAFLLMIEFPEVQKKCQQEIEKVFGDKCIEYAERNKLVYVNATIMEIQRYSTIVPLNVVHYTSKDTTLAGYDIPKDTMVVPSLYSVSMDETYFPNPTKFIPERFIDKDGKMVKNEALIPFSAGPRTCLGEPLARMELFLVFVNLLQRFTFTRERPDQPHSLNAKTNQITNAPKPYKLKAMKRQ
ncbi:cytochrome P450 2D26-like [Mercenaria mercenaria]|uniref:cytochrome P450 2D26-like n=1 Tax=Mercenaria mercenaria TaxID=6596 RepID=UPI00234F3BAD|nr:cytochrome P450 2D26-like [Mercenaria mercenaria]